MINFERLLKLKIIVLAVAVALFAESTVYGIDLCDVKHLRVPLSGTAKMDEVLERFYNDPLPGGRGGKKKAKITFNQNDLVSHQVFGPGIIIKVRRREYTVSFHDSGTKIITTPTVLKKITPAGKDLWTEMDVEEDVLEGLRSKKVQPTLLEPEEKVVGLYPKWDTATYNTVEGTIKDLGYEDEDIKRLMHILYGLPIYIGYWVKSIDAIKGLITLIDERGKEVFLDIYSHPAFKKRVTQFFVRFYDAKKKGLIKDIPADIAVFMLKKKGQLEDDWIKEMLMPLAEKKIDWDTISGYLTSILKKKESELTLFERLIFQFFPLEDFRSLFLRKPGRKGLDEYIDYWRYVATRYGEFIELVAKADPQFISGQLQKALDAQNGDVSAAVKAVLEGYQGGQPVYDNGSVKGISGGLSRTPPKPTVNDEKELPQSVYHEKFHEGEVKGTKTMAKEGIKYEMVEISFSKPHRFTQLVPCDIFFSSLENPEEGPYWESRKAWQEWVKKQKAIEKEGKGEKGLLESREELHRAAQKMGHTERVGVVQKKVIDKFVDSFGSIMDEVNVDNVVGKRKEFHKLIERMVEIDAAFEEYSITAQSRNKFLTQVLSVRSKANKKINNIADARLDQLIEEVASVPLSELENLRKLAQEVADCIRGIGKKNDGFNSDESIICREVEIERFKKVVVDRQRIERELLERERIEHERIEREQKVQKAIDTLVEDFRFIEGDMDNVVTERQKYDELIESMDRIYALLDESEIRDREVRKQFLSPVTLALDEGNDRLNKAAIAKIKQLIEEVKSMASFDELCNLSEQAEEVVVAIRVSHPYDKWDSDESVALQIEVMERFNSEVENKREALIKEEEAKKKKAEAEIPVSGVLNKANLLRVLGLEVTDTNIAAYTMSRLMRDVLRTYNIPTKYGARIAIAINKWQEDSEREKWDIESFTSLAELISAEYSEGLMSRLIKILETGKKLTDTLEAFEEGGESSGIEVKVEEGAQKEVRTNI